MQASADIFFEHTDWRKPLTWSVLLHVGVTVAIILYSVFAHRGSGSNWGAGGGGGAIGVSLVSNIPLPASGVETRTFSPTNPRG